MKRTNPHQQPVLVVVLALLLQGCVRNITYIESATPTSVSQLPFEAFTAPDVAIAGAFACENHDPAHIAYSLDEMHRLTAENNCRGWRFKGIAATTTDSFPRFSTKYQHLTREDFATSAGGAASVAELRKLKQELQEERATAESRRHALEAAIVEANLERDRYRFESARLNGQVFCLENVLRRLSAACETSGPRCSSETRSARDWRATCGQ